MRPPERLFTSARSRRNALLVLLAAVAVALLGAALFERHLGHLDDPAAVRAWVRSYGGLAPVVFVCLQAAQVVVAPIPGHVLGVTSGYLFGTLWGTVYSLLGATIGTAVAVVLARRLGRPFVEETFDPGLVESFDAFTRRSGPLALFAVFLLPGLPDDVICFLAGVTELDVRTVLVLSLVGRFPGYLLSNYAGARFEQGALGEGALVLVLLGALAVVVWIVARSRGLLPE